MDRGRSFDVFAEIEEDDPPELIPPAWRRGQAQESVRLLILTASVPKSGSEGDRALRSVGWRSVFDVIEMFDAPARQRLSYYAASSPREPTPGFWTADELAGDRG